MCIDGHMVQAPVLTHETAKEVELDPYCVTALMPLRLVVVYGQEAKLEPPQTGGKGHCAAGAWWAALGLICSCHIVRTCAMCQRQTLIIIEQDWRLYSEDLEAVLDLPD